MNVGDAININNSVHVNSSDIDIAYIQLISIDLIFTYCTCSVHVVYSVQMKRWWITFT